MLPKPIRKFIAIFRGEALPVMIVLSTLFGFWFGLTPGWQGIHVVILVLALVLNVNLGIFLLFAALGKALAYAAAPGLYFAGQWVIGSLGGLLMTLAAIPVVGLTDFATYAVAGALVVGPVVGLVLGLLLGRLVQQFRQAWLKLDESSEKFRAFQQKTWVRWLDWLLLGKRTKDVKAVLQKKPKLIRMPGVIVAVVVLLGAGIGVYFTSGDQLGGVVAAQLGQANGAEVNLARFNFSPLAGRIEATGIQVTDPQAPVQNRLEIGELTADAGLWSLLIGRLVVDEVAVGGVGFGTPRETPGEVYPTAEAAVAAEEPAFEEERYELPEGQLEELASYFERGEQMKEKLREAAQWLPSREAPPEPEPAAVEGYLGYLTARAPTAPTPRVVVRRARFDEVMLPFEELGRSTIEAENLSDQPAAYGEPVVLKVTSQERPTRVTIRNHYGAGGRYAEIDAEVAEVPLTKLQEQLSGKNPVRFTGGTATAQVSGRADREQVDLAIAVQTAGMQTEASGGFFGLDPQVAGEALKALENLQTELRVVGPVGAPRLALNAPRITAQLQAALMEAGKRELANRMDAELEKQLGDKLPEGTKASEVLEDPVNKGADAIKGLFGGNKDQ